MCVICTDWQKGKLTTLEAMRNLQEVATSTDNWEEISHYMDVAREIKKKFYEDKK